VTDLVYSDVEEDLRAAVRSLLADRAPSAAVLARVSAGDEAVDGKLWQTLAGELGFAGLPVPESAGGGGATWRETAVVLEELGRALAPVPFFGSAVLATAALLAARDDTVLPDVASGARTAALLIPFSGAAMAPFTATSGGTVTGSVRGVADAMTADVLLVPAAEGLFAVEAATAVRAPVTSFDLTRPLADVVLEGVPGRLLGDSGPAVAWALTVGAGMLASEQLGVAEWCLETTVEHVKTRRQFARAIGSYQAVKHRLADTWVTVTEARAVARHAAWCLATGDPDTEVAVALAQAFCGPVAVKAAEECVQLHGGIGFTWEHPAHLYLKRAKADSIALGTADRHRARLAELVDLES
jgi:alkylation response protein AidB-like acyl-CoA dehydrogenase